MLRWLRSGPFAAALILLMLATACSQRDGRGQPRPVGPVTPRELDEAAFLLDPLQGFPREIDAARGAAVAEAFATLTEVGDLAAARARADRLLAGDPGFEPALVLLAEIDLEEGSLGPAIERLQPIVDQHPQYCAAALALARAHDRASEIVEAYSGYRRLADTSAVAASRAGELLPRALEVLSARIEDALSRNDVPRADAELERLSSWSPGATPVLEAARRVAAAKADRKGELAAVAKLSERFPERRDYLERRGDLELAIGRAAAGVEAFRDLVARYPDDAALGEKLERAKFLWRLDLLPGSVRAHAQAAELSRGGFAALMYWVIPDVRYAKPASARIATDILDHPQREAIARVANLGLMQIDSTLHRFAPEAPVSHAQVLTAVLTVLSRHGPRAAACIAGETISAPQLCAQAERCQLLGDSPCLSGGRLSGAEAVEILRRALKWL